MQREKKSFLITMVPTLKSAILSCPETFTHFNTGGGSYPTPLYPALLVFTWFRSTAEKQVTFLFSCWFSFPPYRFMAFGCYSLHLIRVPNDNISIGSYSNPAFPWIQIKDFGSIGAGDSYKLALVHLACGLKNNVIWAKHPYEMRICYSEHWKVREILEGIPL